MKKRKLLLGITAVISAVCIGMFGGGIQAKADNGVTHYFKPYDCTNGTYYDGNLEEKFTMNGVEFLYGLEKTSWRDMHALFNLNNEVQNVSFTVGHIDNAKNDRGTFKVYLDGVIQESYSMNLTSDMINNSITIGTSGHEQLEVVIAGDDARYALGNITGQGKHDYTCEITKVATVRQDGLFTYTCNYCGDSYTVVDSAKKYCMNYLMPYQADNFDIWKENYASSEYFNVMGNRIYRTLDKNSWRDATALYNLSGAYNSVSFTVGHHDNSYTNDGTLKVYVDGTEIKNVPL